MRRIATIAATGAAAAAVIALAVPANAATTNTGSFQKIYEGSSAANVTAVAPATAKAKWHNWTSRSVGEGSAWGTYAKVGKTVYLYGHLHKSRNDTLGVCVQFVWYYHGKAVAAPAAKCIVGSRIGTVSMGPATRGPSYASSLYDFLFVVRGNKIIQRGGLHKVY